MKKKEKIAVIKSSIVNEIIGDNKLYVDNDGKLLKKFNKKLKSKKRYKMEENDNYKQLIPYIVIISEDNEVLSYTRSSKSGEKRLHGFKSIGVGGHIDINEHNKDMTAFELITDAADREAMEELGVDLNLFNDVYGNISVINDNSNDVGKKHIGIPITVRISNETKKKLLCNGETDILVEREFLPVNRLIENMDDYEEWSKIIIENL